LSIWPSPTVLVALALLCPSPSRPVPILPPRAAVTARPAVLGLQPAHQARGCAVSFLCLSLSPSPAPLRWPRPRAARSAPGSQSPVTAQPRGRGVFSGSGPRGPGQTLRKAAAPTSVTCTGGSHKHLWGGTPQSPYPSRRTGTPSLRMGASERMGCRACPLPSAVPHSLPSQADSQGSGSNKSSTSCLGLLLKN
jgi:hypothetical protein